MYKPKLSLIIYCALGVVSSHCSDLGLCSETAYLSRLCSSQVFLNISWRHKTALILGFMSLSTFVSNFLLPDLEEKWLSRFRQSLADRSVLESSNELQTRNSSGDEIANVNFLYDDIVHALQNTID